MRYSVHCPSAPYENSSFVELEDCWGLCLDLSEEYGYAEVRLGDCLMGSYTNGQQANCTLNPQKGFFSCIIIEYTTKGLMSEHNWSELNDSQPDIFESLELNQDEQKFDVEEFINKGDYDYA